jgi:hypothetical protein
VREGERIRTCVTKQTKDLRYIDVEPLWFLSFGLTPDDAVCPGKRVVSWINVCNFYRATKRKKCLSQSCVASSECHGQPAIDGSIAIKKVGPKGCLTSAVSLTAVRMRLLRRYVEIGEFDAEALRFRPVQVMR